MQWDTSAHDWLEGRGERIYLVAMIDDATSRLLARFVHHDSTAETFECCGSTWNKTGDRLSSIPIRPDCSK